MKPLKPYVGVKLEEPIKEKNGVILPDQLAETAPTGIVIALPDNHDYDLKIGDKVAYHARSYYSHKDIELIKIDEILGKIE